MKVIIVPATIEHCERLAPKLRPIDVCDVVQLLNITAADLLRKSIELSSHAWVWLVDGEPVCMFGIKTNNLLAGTVTPWLLASDEIAARRRIFWKGSQQFIAVLRENFALLQGFVDAQNTVSMAWLRRLGFTISPHATIAENGQRFHYFELGN